MALEICSWGSLSGVIHRCKQGGPLLVLNGVIKPTDGLMNGYLGL